MVISTKNQEFLPNFGERSWRYSMLVEDNKITKLFSEPGQEDNCPDDPFTVSDVDTMLGYLKQN